MLQYILTPDSRYSAGELAQMAIEGGCGWISVAAPDLDDAQMRDALVPDVVEMCREAGVFLTVDDRPDLAAELGLHGVRLSRDFLLANPSRSPLALREELGPEAVIGVETGDPSAVPALIPADIDFVTLPADFGRDTRREFVERLRALGVSLPVVARGEFTPQQAADAIADGCNGVAVGDSITKAPDPVVATESIINALPL